MKTPVNEILIGDALRWLKELPDCSVHCCVTSPPYWGLRDYGVNGQLGLEKTPEEYVSRMVKVFSEVRRVLRGDGTLWLNVGDSYSHGGCGARDQIRWPKQSRNDHLVKHNKTSAAKPKNLIGIPWRVAFALQADGWYLRSDIIWSKPNCMPESVTDRPTKSHEYLFLMTKEKKYYYNAKAVREADAGRDHPRNILHKSEPSGGVFSPNMGIRKASGRNGNGRNKRSVWTVSTRPFPGAHFAVFPEDLIKPCVMAGCIESGIVLDPFMGSGTTALVALKAQRKFIGIELNPEYAKMAEQRICAERN